MVYDYREIVFKEILEIDQSDPFYFTKRFRKAYHLLDSEAYKQLVKRLRDAIEAEGLEGNSLHFIEQKLRSSKALKLRNGSRIRLVPKDKIIKKLTALDDELDIMVKKLANSIRWSGNLELRSHNNHSRT